MLRLLTFVFILGIAVPGLAADGKFSVKAVDGAPKVSAPVKAVLEAKGLAVQDAAGKTILTVWPRKALAAKDVSGDVKYGHLEEGQLLGAVEVPAIWGDYRKQKIKPGTYTLRLGMQPMDGDHMGTAPYNEFLLLAPADKDTKPDVIDPKDLHELSAESSGGKHPGVLLLYPNKKPGEPPAIEAKPQDIWLLSYTVPVTAGGKTLPLGFSLVVVGHSMSD